jgi:hypothetical protein
MKSQQDRSAKACVSCTFLLALLCHAIEAQGADRYVRQGATGSGSGTDWANAYPTLPTTLTRGDTYYIADGNYGSYVFGDVVSGTIPITIRKATVTNHGTETGWQDGYGDGQASWTMWSIVTGNYVFDGQGRGVDWRSGYGLKVGPSGGSRHVDMFVGGRATASNITFRYIEIEGNGLDNPTYDRGIYSPNGNDNVRIQYCYLHDFSAVPILTGGVTYWTLEYSLIARNSSSAASHAEGWAASNDSNLVIRYNRWEDIEGTGIIVTLNRGAGVGTNRNWDIYGNVFMMTDGNPYNRTDGLGNGAIAAINEQVAIDWRIYNNTFINLRWGWSSRIQIGNVATGNSGVWIYNNFWWNCNTAAYTLNSCTNCISDYNRYDGTPSGSEANKEIRVSASTTVFANYSTKNFRLATATQGGTVLSPPYDRDMDGVARGSDGSWDRGAFEYGGRPVAAPSPPTNLRIVR